MGAWMSRVWFLMFPAREYKLVVVGLDNAGKTTTLYKLHLGEAVTAAPTIGSNVEEVVFKNLRFEVSSPSPGPPPLCLSFLPPAGPQWAATKREFKAGFAAPRSPPDRPLRRRPTAGFSVRRA
jgi:ADP-ribosylation factor-like protein 5B